MQTQHSMIGRRYVSATAFRPAEFSGTILAIAAALIALSCSGDLGIPKFVELPQITADRVGIVLLCALMAAEIVINRMRIWNLRFTEVSLGIVGLLAGISGIVYGGFFTGYAGGRPDVLLKFCIVPVILFVAIVRTDLSRRSLVTFLIIMAAFGIYLGGTAIAERLGYTWALFPSNIGDPAIEQHWGRARGPFLQAEFNGTVMAMLVPLVLVLTSFRDRLLRVIGFLVALLLCVGCYLTYTRAVLLSLVVIIVGGCWLGGPVRKSYRALLLMLCLSAGILVTSRSPLASRLTEMAPVTARLQLLASTLEMIAAHPLTGVGFVNFDHVQKQYYDPAALGELRNLEDVDSSEFWEGGTHNSLLTPVAELGVFVGGLYVFLVVRVLFKGFRRLRLEKTGSKTRTALLTSAMLMGVAFVINALFVELRYTLTPNALFWVGAAFIERASQCDRSTGVQEL